MFVLRKRPNVLLTMLRAMLGWVSADGRYGAFEILSYYCPAAQAGCITIRYMYQGAGGTSLER